MSHGPHEAMPGYQAGQILVDGCYECEQRGQDAGNAICNMDSETFRAAWKRAAQWNLHGNVQISRAESAALNAIWAIQVKLEYRGIPISFLPTGNPGELMLLLDPEFRSSRV